LDWRGDREKINRPGRRNEIAKTRGSAFFTKRQ
jgi:hypothetical protein